MREVCKLCRQGEWWVGCANPACKRAGPPRTCVGIVRDGEGATVDVDEHGVSIHDEVVTYRRGSYVTGTRLVWLWIPVEVRK